MILKNEIHQNLLDLEMESEQPLEQFPAQGADLSPDRIPYCPKRVLNTKIREKK